MKKPVVDMKRCFASQSVCTAIKCCPVSAVSYVEVLDEPPILDKTLKCNCAPPIAAASPFAGKSDCGCDGGCGDDLYSCGGNPYGRIIINYDLCILCGLCAKECCGTAIDLV
jgi:hypothetical protein